MLLPRLREGALLMAFAGICLPVSYGNAGGCGVNYDNRRMQLLAILYRGSISGQLSVPLVVNSLSMIKMRFSFKLRGYESAHLNRNSYKSPAAHKVGSRVKQTRGALLMK